MKIKSIFLTGICLITACNLFTPQPAAGPNVQPPTQAPATKMVPTAEPTSTPPSALFRDDFNQVLAGGWMWQNEDTAAWSLNAKAGWLEVFVSSGHVVTGNYSNLLLRSPFDGDFQIETRLEFEPVANFQFAGLIVYESDSNFLQAGRAFCEGGFNCIGDGLYIDYYKDSTFQESNFATQYDGGNVVHLRLLRTGDVYTFYASADGMNWTEIGQHQSDLEPRLVGLVAAQNNDGVPIPARFDYFMLTELR